MGTRWLLYDAGCSVCAALAREVETLSGGRLRVRSLREPEIQALLDRARPGWRWEPMLVEIEGERVRVFAGLAMRWRLVQVLGPVRALRAAQAVARMGGPVLGVDWGRRRLLRQSLALAGLALLRRIPGGTHAPRTAGSAPPRLGPGEGELWEGFVLLPEGAPIPPFVRQVPTPILCQTDGRPEAEALRGETLTFAVAFPHPVPLVWALPAAAGDRVAGRNCHSICAFGGGVFGVLELWGWGGGAADPGDRPADVSVPVSGVAGVCAESARGADLSGEGLLHPQAGAAAAQRPGASGALDRTKHSLCAY
jgi:predicted DCC family thiol-disulfide oxidoreductase YuxK